MANPVDFAGNNANFTPAPGNEATVKELPAYHAHGEVITCWKLSDEELTHVILTGEVWASVRKNRDDKLSPMFLSGLPLMQLQDENGEPKPGYSTDMVL